MNYFENAKEKINRELGSVKTDRYGEVIKKPTAEMLIKLSAEYEGLAKAITEGGSFEECIKHCCPKGNTSDLEVYKKAIEFYIPKATVDYKIVIEMPDENKKLQFSVLDFI